MRAGSGPEWADAQWVRRTRIETSLSAFGAGFVGLAVGLLLGQRLPLLGWVLLAIGLLSHGAAMVALHRRFSGRALPGIWWWLEGAYWVCWAVLLAIAGFLVWLAVAEGSA